MDGSTKSEDKSESANGKSVGRRMVRIVDSW